MIKTLSMNNVPIRLTIERWNHIVKRHPELHNQKDRLLECVASPDLIQNGDFGELIALRFYHSTPMTSKYLVVVYKEVTNDDGFVVTAYYTNKPSQRRITLWMQ